jgi:hypothetical protein
VRIPVRRKEAGRNGRCLEGERVRRKPPVHIDYTRRKDPMTERWMSALALLIFATCLQPQAATASEKSQNSGKDAGLTTIEGCLQSSNGQYLLTDSTGTVHLLSGAANKLGHQVGRQVGLTGKPGIGAVDTTSAGMASSAAEQTVFEVKTVKRIADVCK